jgi:hypothetical protein
MTISRINFFFIATNYLPPLLRKSVNAGRLAMFHKIVMITFKGRFRNRPLTINF